MNAHITVLPGDGIGPEVTGEAVRVLTTVAERFGHRCNRESASRGHGDRLPGG